MADLTIKRGDSISWTCVRKDSDGVVVDITSTTIRAQMRHSSSSLTLTVTKTDAANGAFTLTAAYADTGSLTPAVWLCDIEYTDGTDRKSTETFSVAVVEDQSHD